MTKNKKVLIISLSIMIIIGIIIGGYHNYKSNQVF